MKTMNWIKKYLEISIARAGFIPTIAALWVMLIVTVFLIWVLTDPNPDVMALGAGVLGLVGLVFTFYINSVNKNS